MPSAGRWALLIFGNVSEAGKLRTNRQVDLQINYLWQLQHKPITSNSFPPDTKLSSSLISPDNVTDITGYEDDSLGLHVAPNVLASATETTLKGPALGPDLFVEAVLKAYTTFLEREILNGPIGNRIRDRQPCGTGRRASPAGKVLIAAALPPLVEDHILPRIPEKYVERLEEQHEQSQRAQGWPNSPPLVADYDPGRDQVELDLQALAVIDLSRSSTSGSSRTSSSSSRASSIFENEPMEASAASVFTASSDHSEGRSSKLALTTLLAHDPPLCTLPVRNRMTNLFNAGLATFCAKHSDVFGLVDITPAMQPVDRATWACPVDPTNIHPLWEPTLPLWLDALAEHGIPTDGYSITEDAEETFRAYEVDKKRRTEIRDEEWAGDWVKFRDE